MTSPFGASKWEDAGWRPPTPHQVLAFLMLIAACVAVTGIGPAWLVKLFVVLTAGTGSAGISAAKNYLSPQVRSKLEAVDAKAMGAMDQSPPVEAVK